MNFFLKLYRFSSSWTGTIVIVAFVIFFIAQAFVIPTRSMVGTLYEGDMLFVKKFAYGIPIPRIPWIEIPVFPDLRGDGHLFQGKRPKRGEVVVFIPPHVQKTYYVKRNFAIGGDEVIYARDGLYLHPKEGEEFIAQNYFDMPKKKFFGKTYIKNPYIKEYPGVHYGLDNAVFDHIIRQISFDGQNWSIVQTCQNETTKELYPCNESFSMTPLLLSGLPISGLTLAPYRSDEVIFYKKIAEDEFFMIGDNRDNSLDSRYWGSVPYSQIIGTPWLVYFSLNLANSIEAKEQAQELGKEEEWWKYTVRWNRVFRSVESLEEELRARGYDGGI